MLLRRAGHLERARPAHRLTVRAMAFACALFASQGAHLAQADEVARLSNLLFLEQLIDVDTTQTITHQMACAVVPIVDGTGRLVGIGRPCVHGFEADPLARPFVVTPTSNLLAAAAINGLVRLVFHGHSRRLLRLGIEIYPVVFLANVETSYTIAHFATTPMPALRPQPLR